MALKDITRAAVLAAIAECDKIGQDEFLSRHGFGEARFQNTQPTYKVLTERLATGRR
ncbi:hypothetical protein [Lentzea sp. NPDC055074]